MKMDCGIAGADILCDVTEGVFYTGRLAPSGIYVEKTRKCLVVPNKI